jgi:hypothetical protein
MGPIKKRLRHVSVILTLAMVIALSGGTRAAIATSHVKASPARIYFFELVGVRQALRVRPLRITFSADGMRESASRAYLAPVSLAVARVGTPGERLDGFLDVLNRRSADARKPLAPELAPSLPDGHPGFSLFLLKLVQRPRVGEHLRALVHEGARTVLSDCFQIANRGRD